MAISDILFRASREIGDCLESAEDIDPSLCEWMESVADQCDRLRKHMESLPQSTTDLRPTRNVRASEWLIERFREKNEWKSNDIVRVGREYGINRDALFEAKDILGLPKPRKVTDENGITYWVWWVPENWSPPAGTSGSEPRTE